MQTVPTGTSDARVSARTAREPSPAAENPLGVRKVALPAAKS